MTQHAGSLEEIRARRRIARRSRPYSNRVSQLERYKATVITLHEEGASLGEIQYYLRAMATPALSVERSTIKRYLDKQKGR